MDRIEPDRGTREDNAKEARPSGQAPSRPIAPSVLASTPLAASANPSPLSIGWGIDDYFALLAGGLQTAQTAG